MELSESWTNLAQDKTRFHNRGTKLSFLGLSNATIGLLAVKGLDYHPCSLLVLSEAVLTSAEEEVVQAPAVFAGSSRDGTAEVEPS